jgi:hypothetical protein
MKIGKKRVQLGVVLDQQRDRKMKGEQEASLYVHRTHCFSVSAGALITTWDATIPRAAKQGSRRIDIADSIMQATRSRNCGKVRDTVESQRPDGDVMTLQLSTSS